MQRTDKSAEEAIASLPDEYRSDVARLDEIISAAMPGQEKTVWEGKFWGGSNQTIIGYGDYSYTRPKGETVEWFIVGLAAQKNYMSIYVNAAQDGKYVAELYADRLGKAKVGKSVISFRRLEDINLDALLEVIEKAQS